jgi:FKBP-type peptidyl-prolyl cis-trans isomerase FkpA
MDSHIRSVVACPGRCRAALRAVVACVALAAAAGCGGDDSSPTSPSTDSAPYSQTDIRVGTGAEATAGRNVTVNYTLWFYSATAPENKGQRVESGTFPFVLGSGGTIRGFDQGVAGMRVGGLRRIVVPPELAYGAGGSNDRRIPPNATLVFEVELTSVQ